MALPSPYSMCSTEECKERQAQKQVSEWEATEETFDKLPTQRIMDRHLAVAKYRRSAAGDTRRRPPRTLLQLEKTWQHLLTIFVRQSIHSNMSPRSLRNTVSFVDDRVRAVQTDFVVLQEASSSLQAQLVRYQLICCHLLSEVPRQHYEPKFARRALWTALTAYWNDDSQHRIHDDEILCYTALCQVATCLIQQDNMHGIIGGWDDDSPQVGFGTILLLAHRCLPTKSYPKFEYALGIVTQAILGFHRNILSLLSKGNDAFSILCRCCMAPALNVIRIGAIRHYNKAFGKRETISGLEMARLLFLPSAKSALEFGAAVGLPIEDDTIVMKAAPVSMSSPLYWSRQEDAFVFGKSLEDCGRVDEEGVLIPPESLLQSLIVSDDLNA
jgi:hypothetical protein